MRSGVAADLADGVGLLHAVPHGIQFALIQMSRHRAAAASPLLKAKPSSFCHTTTSSGRRVATRASFSVSPPRSRRANRGRHRSCRRWGRNRCASRRAPAAANRRSLPAAPKMLPAASIRGFSPAPSIKLHHVRASGDVGIGVGDAAHSVRKRPTGRPPEDAEFFEVLAKTRSIHTRPGRLAKRR